jgi:hypothetical protein
MKDHENRLDNLFKGIDTDNDSIYFFLIFLFQLKAISQLVPVDVDFNHYE